MRVAMMVPGGVDRSGEYRIIPALVSLLARLSRAHDVQVFALAHEEKPGEWQLAGAHIHNLGLPYSRRRIIRTVLAEHRRAHFDVIHSIWSGSGGFLSVVAARLMCIPSVVHVAGGELVALHEIGYGGMLRLPARLRERFTLAAASVVTTASAPVIDIIAGLGVVAQRVPLGVDLEAWPPREPVRRAHGARAKLIHVASLNRVKDQTTLLRALAALSRRGIDFHINVIGDDTLAGRIQALASELGLSATVSFRGFLPQRLLLPLVAAADLMIVTSLHETGPLVVLEAAAVGVPTVGTAVGHIAEWAPRAALAVPVADPDALAGAIAAMLADEELRLSIAREASRRARLEDADHTAQAFTKIYTKLTTPARRRSWRLL